MTQDPGVRDMLSFLIARDTMHQNQWMAAIAELEADGLESTPCPSNFPQEREKSDVAYQFIHASEGEESAQGSWASGRSPDGKGEFTYAPIQALSDDAGQLSQGSTHASTARLRCRFRPQPRRDLRGQKERAAEAAFSRPRIRCRLALRELEAAAGLLAAVLLALDDARVAGQEALFLRAGRRSGSK
jgi:hypothetical protein